MGSLVILDVGHGNAAVLHGESGTILIDTGRGSAVLEYLTARGIGHIDVVLISHADQDHIGGLALLVASREFTIGKVRLNSDGLKGSAIWDDLLWALNEEAVKGKLDFAVSLSGSQTESFGVGDATLDVVAPSTYLAARGPGSTDRMGRRLTSNSISAVLRVRAGDRSICVLAADLDWVGLANLEESSMACDAPVLVFPHHGGRPGPQPNIGAFCRRVCELTRPNLVIFSNGRGRYDTPMPEIVLAVRQWKPEVKLLCTQLSESCAPTLPLPAPKRERFSILRAEGSVSGKCCGGTIELHWGDVEAVVPAIDAHEAFVLLVAPNALCRRPIAIP